MPFYKICVFSDVKGRVVMDGKPVAGAMVKRSYRVRSVDIEGSDSSTTDAEGRFSLPAIWRFSLTAWTSANPAVFQEIHIEHGGRRFPAYSLTKHVLSLDGELLREIKPGDSGPWGIKIRLLCDLNAPETKKTFRSYIVLDGICRVVSDEEL